MSMKDKIQAKLSWLQLIFSLGVGVSFSIVGWLATASSIKPIIGIAAVTILIMFSVGLVWVNTLITKNINSLKDLP